MKETKILKNSEVTQPDSQTEQNKDCHVCQKHSARVWESISTPKHNCPNRKIKSQAEILDNFTENSIEALYRALADKDKIISELENKLNQPLTNQELLFNLLKKLESEELMFCFEDEDNKLYLEDQTSEGGESRIYLFNLNIEDDKISVFYEKGEYWKEVNDKFREEFLKEQKKPVILLDEFEKNNSKLVKISGILTSQIRSKPSSDTPFMAFVRLDTDASNYIIGFKHHSLEECANSKCKDCEIPVIFRVKPKTKFCSSGVHKEDIECSSWKPKLKKGDSVILEGKFSPSENSKRPSFTCYSYQILKDHERN